jgi:hypothetical protein
MWWKEMGALESRHHQVLPWKYRRHQARPPFLCYGFTKCILARKPILCGTIQKNIIARRGN